MSIQYYLQATKLLQHQLRPLSGMLLRDQLCSIGVFTRRNLRRQVLLVKPTRGLEQKHANALTAPEPRMHVSSQVGDGCPANCDKPCHLVRPSLAAMHPLTGLGMCLAMLSWPLVSVALRLAIATPVASDPKAVVEEQHSGYLKWKTE